MLLMETRVGRSTRVRSGPGCVEKIQVVFHMHRSEQWPRNDTYDGRRTTQAKTAAAESRQRSVAESRQRSVAESRQRSVAESRQRSVPGKAISSNQTT